MTVIDKPIFEAKAAVARKAVAKHRVSTFADLGACFGVHAGYSLDLLSRFPIREAIVVDKYVTDLSRERGSAYPQLKFSTGIMNERPFIEAFPFVDALIMYDILLHQVDLDWNDFITEWSKRTRVLVIVNQMWAKDDKTIRFLDQGLEWYKKWVFHSNPSAVESWFEHLDDVIDPDTGRKNRDRFNFWQFGITRRDLVSHIESLGFRLDYFEHLSNWPKYDWIKNEAFVFVR